MPQKQKFTDQQLLNLYYRNLNDRQIAEILNVKKTTIGTRRWKLNLMPQKPQCNSKPEFNYRKMRKTHNKNTKKWQIKNPEKYKQINKKSGKKYRQKPKNKSTKRKTNQEYYQKKLKENPNYNKEQYKKRKIKKQQPS